MGTGLHIEITNIEDGTSFTKDCGFPARFGRNDLYNVQLNYGFVSDQHASVELRGDALFLIDHRSRNGTILPNGQPAPPEQPVNLGEHDNAFSIGPLRISVNLAETVDEEVPNTEISTITGKALTRRVEGVERLAQGANLDAIAEEIRSFVDAHQEAEKALLQATSERISELNPKLRAAAIAQLARTFPMLARVPEFRRFAEHHGVALAAQDREAAAALDEARHTAEELGAPPLKTVADIEGFFRKLRETGVQQILAFLPLRTAFYRPELNQGAAGEPVDPGLITAATPAEVADAWLNWNRPYATGRALRAMYAAMMAHQVTLLNGVIGGTTGLVQWLAPASIEELIRRGQGRAPRRFSLGRWRALWDEYRLLHSEIPVADLRAFLHWVFGEQVLRAFETLVGQAEAEGRAAAQLPHTDTSRRHARPNPEQVGYAEPQAAPKRSGPQGTVVMPQAVSPNARARKG